MRALGLVLAVIGGVAGSAGYWVYQRAGQVIARGERLWGLGWLGEQIGPEAASIYQLVGLAAMVTGGILMVVGLIYAVRR